MKKSYHESDVSKEGHKKTFSLIVTLLEQFLVY